MENEFFEFLYEYCKGKVNIRPIPGGNEFHPSDCFEWLAGVMNHHKGKNLYFGVATRDGKGGGKQNIVNIPALFIDLDLKETPRETVINRFKEIPLKPSAVVETGGGWHLYWRLKEPLGKDDIGNFENYLLRLATYFHGDLNAIDASRILRVPGSKNHKYTPPKLVVLKQLNKNLEYSIEDFDFLPQAEKPKAAQGKTKEEILSSLHGVGQGDRNATCTMLAGRYLAKGLTKQETIEILLSWNLRNKPPLPDDEVIQTVDSVSKTDNRNHPITYPHIKQILEKVEKDIRAGKGKPIGLDPGFKFLQRSIRALIPSHLWIVGGYTSIGKTTFVIDLIMRILKSDPGVAVFSLEMSSEQYALRMIANQTGISVLNLMFDEIGDEQNMVIHDAFQMLSKTKVYLFDNVYRWNEIENICRILNKRVGIDLVVIDFIQNLLGKGSIYDRMSQLSPKMQALAKELNLTVMALSQVSNEAAKESLEIIGYKGAGEIAAAADLAIWLQRIEKEEGKVKALIRKNRHGPLGKRTLKYVSNYTRFEEEDEVGHFQAKYGKA